MNLTTAQHAILTHAIDHTGGRITWFPDNIKGGARKKVIDGLSNRGLITSDGSDWFVAAEASFLALKAQPRVRDNSKQALVIRMLRRPKGATIDQICEATSWQAHTVRGTLAGALKKKLGLNITSDKQNGKRIYRIAEH